MKRFIKKLLSFILWVTVIFISMSQATVAHDKNIMKSKTVNVVNFALNDSMGSCSGVIIKQNSQCSGILTAKHCVEDRRLIKVENIIVKKIKTSEKYDLAYLETEFPILNKSAVKLRLVNVEKGDYLFFYGYPKFKDYYRKGVLFFNNEDQEYSDLVLMPGCSGGAIFDSNYRLAGIAVAAIPSFHVSIFESIESVREFLQSIDGSLLES